MFTRNKAREKPHRKTVRWTKASTSTWSHFSIKANETISIFSCVARHFVITIIIWCDGISLMCRIVNTGKCIKTMKLKSPSIYHPPIDRKVLPKMNDTKRNLILLANEFSREHNTSTCQTHRFVRQFTEINKVFRHSLFEFIYSIELVRRIFHHTNTAYTRRNDDKLSGTLERCYTQKTNWKLCSIENH